MQKKWTDEEVLSILESYKTASVKELQIKYSLTNNQITYALYNYKLKKPKPKNFWTAVKSLFLQV
jgi:hypothetical protein|tara:strand:+ start:96 stop:290 length:195 start_codon:yes stop_codon:yes gene_type:complete